ncbi:MAG: 4-hydroxy-tetrahydrodipicolinate synthase [Chitinophagales bacterium]|nr:4-hydroxy-tetrahydrodipicolinate synthase [Chitinophagales bacterium]
MHQFAGTGVALVTPFNNDSSIDFNSLEKLVNHVIDGGVNFLVALGSTGETPTLNREEQQKVLSFIVETCNGRVPVVCGIAGNDTAEVVNNVKTYDLTGVAGILSASPHYNKPSQEGIYQHFKAIATATDKPIILYNVPGRTGSNMAPATVLRLANEFKNIVAIKEASGNLGQCMELVKDKPAHFAILSGDDDLFICQAAIGMEGVISVAANSFPKDFTTMVNHLLAGDFAVGRAMHYKLIDGIRLLFAEGNPTGVKCTLDELGICPAHVRLPLVKATDDLRAKIKTYLSNN